MIYFIVSLLLIIIVVLLIIVYHYQEQLNEKFFKRSASSNINSKTVSKNITRYDHKPTEEQLKKFKKNNTGPYTECIIYIEKEWKSRDNWYLLCSDKYYAPTGLLYVHDEICTIEGIPKGDIYIKQIDKE